MANEDPNLVTVSTMSKKKSLLERYDIPIEHLSYEYISGSTSVKELERIVLILRSGEEGIYTDLTEHAEKRLAEIHPQSRVLRVAEPVVTKEMLAPDKRKKLENDIDEWSSEMKLLEKDLEEGRALPNNEPNSQPDIRRTHFNEPKKQQSSRSQKESKRIGACDYASWDKYDADTEINRIDLQHEKKQAEAKRMQQKLRAKEERIRKESREAAVNKLTLTGTELTVMAGQERKKGNEAFRVGDYEEALLWYNASIAIDETIDACNNRAITFIKLRRYNEAVNDCDRVITMDPANVKAHLRRGSALEYLENKSQALMAYETALKSEPSNKVAIAALNRLRRPCDSKNIRMKIEEETTTAVEKKYVDEKISPGDEESSAKLCSEGPSRKFSSLSQSQSSRGKDDRHLTPTTVESSFALSRPQVCFCNHAPSSSQQSSPLPHIRDAYCSPTPRKLGKPPKSQSIFTGAKLFAKKSSVVIDEIPNEKCDESREKLELRKSSSWNHRKTETTLASLSGGDEEKIAKRSSVVIEEIRKKSATRALKFESTENEAENLPIGSAPIFGSGDNEKVTNRSTEYCEKILKKSVMEVSECDSTGNKMKKLPPGEVANFGAGDNETIVKQCPVSIEEIQEKSFEKSADETPQYESSRDEITRVEPAIVIEEIQKKSSEDLTENETGNASRKLSIGMTSTCIEKFDLVPCDSPKKKYIPKSESTIDREFDEIESPFEFLRLWHSLKNDPDLTSRGKLLKSLSPDRINAVIGNKMDGQMLTTILRCFESHFSLPEDSTILYRYLRCLAKVERFSVVKMFMDDNDKRVLQSLFSALEAERSPENIQDLRTIYDVPYRKTSSAS